MTDEKTEEETASGGEPVSEVPALEAEAAAPAGETVEVTTEPAPRRLPLLLGTAALLLALAACAFTALLWLNQREAADSAAAGQPRVDELTDSIAANRDELGRAGKQLDTLRADNEELDRELERYKRTLDDRLESLESVPGRLSAVESSLSSLQGISSGVRDKWLLAEAEYYMEIANARLQLAGDPVLALIALQLADERIKRLADPSLTEVRRALADEQQTLGELDPPDIAGAALTLASLAGAVESLPLKTDIEMPDDDTAAAGDELTGMDRALASLKSAFSKAVSVRRTDQPVKPLLPPDAAYFLRSNLALQLQGARIALLRGKQAIYEQSLNDAARWIAEYYDTGSMPVKSALATIAELGEAEFSAATPDISGSLTLLRRYNTLKAQERQAAAPRDSDAAADDAQ